MAHGGEVHYCSTNRPHLPGCEYFASGGMPKEDPKIALGHAAAHHGLLGMFKEVGRSRLADPDKHKKILDDAKMHQSRLADREAVDEPVKKTMGVRLANHLTQGEYDKAADLMQGHPMMGGMGKGHLSGTLERLSGPIMSNDPHPEALRSSVDYLHSATKGHSALSAKANSILGAKKSEDIAPEDALRDALKGHLDEMQKSPEKMLEVGGDLGHYMPEHATELAAMLTTATEYLSSLKPKPVQMAPLDEPIPADRAATASYDRQIDIAEQPLLVMQHVKDGTLLPQDVKTIETIYPGLYQSMKEKAGEALINAKAKGTEIPYSQKQTMSMLLGEPLDSTLTPQSMQAIIMSQRNQKSESQQQEQKKNDKATEVELKAINRADDMAETPLQSRQIAKKD